MAFNIMENITVMKKYHVDIWSKSLSIVLFFMTMLIFLPLVYHFGVALHPTTKQAVNGHVTIDVSDYSERQILALDGDWSFFWQKLLEPEQAKATIQQSTLMKGSGGWQSDQDKTGHDATGYATYYLNVNLQQKTNDLAIYIPQIESAYKLYINSEFMASAGVVTDISAAAKPEYNNTIVQIPDGLQTFTITIQVSNYHSSWGGLWAPIVLGDNNSLHTINRDKVALSMFILGALLITAIYSLMQFFLRPADNIPLIFTCLCLLLFLREFTVEHMNFALSSFTASFALITKLNFFSYYAGIPTALYFFHQCYPRIFHLKLCTLVYSICVCFSIFVLFFPTLYFGMSVDVFQVIAVLVMLYIAQRMWVAMYRKQKGAGTMLLGCLVAFAFVLNDILNMNGMITTGRFFSLGIVAFILCQSFVTISRFDNLINENASLTNNLKERNTDLELMSQLLETKVEQRTRDLKLANKELKTLANNDPLTHTFNRHGLQQYIQAAFERYRRSQEAFSILLIDYDHFKEINDNYGHDVGDIVLLTGADLIKSEIREQDKLARWGGEEFLILLPETTLEGAMAIAVKLKAVINAKPIGQPLGITVSITGGVAQVNNNDTFETLFKRADDALYKGKQAGRNRIFSES